MKLRSNRNTDRRSASVTGLYDLPPELLDWVISYADQVDLLNLSLVCKSFNKLVASRLYAEYINTNLQYRRPISKFLLRVAQDASLAHHVRRLELGVWNTKLVFLHPGFRKDVPALPDDQFDALVAAAKQTGLVQDDQDCLNLRPIRKNNDLWCEYGSTYDSDGYTSDDLDEFDSDSDSDSEGSAPSPNPKSHDDVEFLRCLKRGIEDPQVILLLSKLPRLQELSLRGPHMSQGLPWDRLCSQSLTSLTKLKLAGNSSDSTWDIAEINTVIRLPSLRELHGYMATSDEWDDVVNKYLQVEPKSLSLTHIYLERCALGPKTIKNLIEGCKALEAFSYVAGGRYVGYEQFRAKEAKEHLLKHKATLKYLALDLSHWDFPRNFTSFKSMADFTNLEKIVMDYGTLRWKPTHFLAPVTLMEDDDGERDDDGDVHAANTQPPLPDLLPASLQELVIFQAPPVIIENLIAFETSSRDQHPHLKSVQIHTSKRKVAQFDDHKRLPDIFKEKGIEYAEPPIDMQFPIPQMHDWIMDTKIRLMTRWNPKDKKYQSFSTRPSYRRFCEEVLHEDPTASGGPLDPATNFAYGFEDDLISYLDDRFEEEMTPSEADWEIQRSLENEQIMLDVVQGIMGPLVPPGVAPNVNINHPDMGHDDEIESEGSYVSLTDDSFDHEDDLEDEFDDDGLDSDLDSELSGQMYEPMAYYEWDCFY
ncbi:hypothetical protein DIS24_g5777 [Lasiodiplodia hormozganensis]|uniref:F-box domain-containing protein n=1 Tax=Lasiodiplodia hormozganensis TaxID=869390 RepID=A0AA40CYB5_9PEZI|nr:hypothetical protein DIS24_g5777 [Lasiodiplodia hormozganensis]